MTVQKRIKLFLKKSRLTVAGLEKSIGKSNGYINSTENYSMDVLTKIAIMYPQLNLNWLFTEQGEMLITDTKTRITEPAGDDGKSEEVVDSHKTNLKEEMSFRKLVSLQLDDLTKKVEHLIDLSEGKTLAEQGDSGMGTSSAELQDPESPTPRKRRTNK